MSERSGMDPADLWRQWYETGTRMWTGALQGNGESIMDPWGLYRQWFEGMENMREQTMRAMSQRGAAASVPAVNGSETSEAWRKSVEDTMEGWRKSAELSNEMVNMAPRWMEMLGQARENMMSVERYPKDPLEFAVQWYNATGGPYSEFVQEIIEREEFLDQGSRFLRNYASFYKIFRKNSEEYLRNLQLPTRSDITRVASLIVALEEKVDGIEEALEGIQDAQDAAANDGKIEALEKQLDQTEDSLDKRIGRSEEKLEKRIIRREDKMEQRLDRVESKLDEISTAMDQPADTSAVDSLSGRMDEVESKLDQIIAILEQPSDTSATDNLDERVDQVEGKHDQLLTSLGDLGPDAGADNTPETNASDTSASSAPSNGSDNDAIEVRATDAARRKARDMGVDLAEIQGTGADGQITVEDVRKKGEA